MASEKKPQQREKPSDKTFPVTEYLRCAVCRQLLPPIAFTANGTTCQQCRDLHQRSKELAQARASRMTALGKLSTAINDAAVSNVNCIDLVNKVVDRFGGLDGFAEFYAGQINLAATSAPGSKRVLDACRDISRLAIRITEMTMENLRDVDRMTEEELETETVALVNRLMPAIDVIRSNSGTFHAPEPAQPETPKEPDATGTGQPAAAE